MTLELVGCVKRFSPEVFLFVGGHSAAAYPSPFFRPEVDAICVEDGERVVPLLVDALSRSSSLSDVEGLLLRSEDGYFRSTRTAGVLLELDEVPLPARHHVERWRREYACLQFRPMWLVETARGCPYRCSFCSVWPMFGRSFRERSIEAVCRDFAAVGPNVFIADDLFWYSEDRSWALALELAHRGVRKKYVLVQSRVDTVVQRADILSIWRSLAEDFDIFFGLEAATDEFLTTLHKDTTTSWTTEAVRIARDLNFGVTGNFVIDPDWDETDFARLWEFVDRHRLNRAGYTILTPLPGTPFFEESKHRVRASSWAQFDMHHLLWEPKLGSARFFELYCQTWARSVLNLRGEKKWWQWVRQTRIRDLPFLARLLAQTQHIMKPESYLAEHLLGGGPAFSEKEVPAYESWLVTRPR